MKEELAIAQANANRLSLQLSSQPKDIRHQMEDETRQISMEHWRLQLERQQLEQYQLERTLGDGRNEAEWRVNEMAHLQTKVLTPTLNQ